LTAFLLKKSHEDVEVKIAKSGRDGKRPGPRWVPARLPGGQHHGGARVQHACEGKIHSAPGGFYAGARYGGVRYAI
jgi:hypothetical protein